MRNIQLIIKRIFDFIASLLGVIVTSPIIILIAIIVKLTSKGPIFFIQERIGKKAEIFRLYKFRTMIPGAINIGAGISVGENDARITKIGSFLRKTSLDELPQIFNVLKGDISLVGPRPTVVEHLEYYGEHEKKRLEMNPGITGLAMVKGRNKNPWSVRINYDIEYIEKFNLWLDLVILIKTVWVVLARKDTYYDYEKNGPAFDLVKPAERNKQNNND